MPIETMTVPVISTAHLPSSTAVEDLGVLHAKYKYGYFVWMDESEHEPWYATIREWAKHHASDEWVRFDCDADPVPELTTYNW